MKRTLSVTLSRYAKATLKPNVSTSIDRIVRDFSDPEILNEWMVSQKTSILLDDNNMDKLLMLSESIKQPIPRIVTAMIELCAVKGTISHPKKNRGIE